MTSDTGRLYALALGLVVFFLTWAVLAARPWSGSPADPRAAALRLRESHLRTEARLVDRVVARRWSAYRRALRARRSEVAAARRQAVQAPVPALRVVTLPPLTITRTS